MRRGILIIISEASGYSTSAVYRVNRGAMKNKLLEELITLAKTDRALFADRIEEERAITAKLYPQSPAVVQ